MSKKNEEVKIEETKQQVAQETKKDSLEVVLKEADKAVETATKLITENSTPTQNSIVIDDVDNVQEINEKDLWEFLKNLTKDKTKYWRVFEDEKGVPFIELEGHGTFKIIKSIDKYFNFGVYNSGMNPYITRTEFTKEINRLDQKIDNLEKKMDQKIDDLEKKMDQKIDNLEKKMDQKIDNLEKKMDQKFAEQDKKFDKKFAEMMEVLKEIKNNQEQKQ